MPNNRFMCFEYYYFCADRHGRDHIVVGFSTICVISAYHHSRCEFEPHSWRGVLDTTLCNKVCLWLGTGPWFSPGIPISSTNKTDCHDITEILLKMALKTINQTKPFLFKIIFYRFVVNDFLIFPFSGTLKM